MLDAKFIPLGFVATLILVACLFIAYQTVGNFQSKELNADLIKKNASQEAVIFSLKMTADSLKHELELFEDSVNVYQTRFFDLQQDARKLREDYADRKRSYEREVATLMKLHEAERQLIINQKNKIIYEN